MLATGWARRRPNPVEPGVGPQIVNMPVRSLRHLLMVCNTGLQATRTQGAADVNIETSTQFEWTEFPDLNPLLARTKEN